MDESDIRQVGGAHYVNKEIQPWQAMEAWMTTGEFQGFLRGSIIKYVARYPEKGGVGDLHKARHFLDKLIEVYESPADENIQWHSAW